MRVGQVSDTGGAFLMFFLLLTWPRSLFWQVFKHENYNGYTINNDILLIKLASPAQLNMRVSPVCVAEIGDNFPGGMMCVTSGWGLTRYNGETNKTAT